MIKKIIVSTFVFGVAVTLSQADVITFSTEDGYTEGQSVGSTGETLLDPASAGVAYAQGGGGAGNSVTASETLKIYAPSGGDASWVKDKDGTVYDNVSGQHYRSADMTIASEAKNGSKGSIGLYNAAVDDFRFGASTYNANLVLNTDFLVKDAATGQLLVSRIDNTGTRVYWHFFNKEWDSSGTPRGQNYNRTDTINVTYVYDADTDEFQMTIENVTAGTELMSTTLSLSEMASFVGGTNAMQFAVGHPYNNSGQGFAGTVDNVSTAPEQPKLGLLILSSLMTLF